MRPASAGSPSSPKPPASSAGVRPRGSSSSASGLPRVSATIRSRTRSSSGPATTASSSARASPSSSPPTTSSVQPVEAPLAGAARARRGPARPTRPAGGAPRTRAPAPTPRRATARRPRRRPAAAPRPRRTAGSGPPGRRGTGPGRRRRAGRTPCRARRAAGRGGARGDPRTARTADATRRTRAPSPTRRPPRARRAQPGRARHQVLQQRALADAGLAAQHQRPARARAHARHQLIQRRALAAPAEQIAAWSWPRAEATSNAYVVGVPELPVPSLADDVVLLRPWREADVPAQLAAFGDLFFLRFSDWAPQTEAGALAYLAGHEQARRRGEQIELALVEPHDESVLLGGGSLNNVDLAPRRLGVPGSAGRPAGADLRPRQPRLPARRRALRLHPRGRPALARPVQGRPPRQRRLQPAARRAALGAHRAAITP